MATFPKCTQGSADFGYLCYIPINSIISKPTCKYYRWLVSPVGWYFWHWLLYWTNYLSQGTIIKSQNLHLKPRLPYEKSILTYSRVCQKSSTPFYNNAFFENTLWENQWNGHRWKSLYPLVKAWFKHATNWPGTTSNVVIIAILALDQGLFYTHELFFFL